MKPFLLIIDGPSGAGKTTAAELVHKQTQRTALLGLDRLKWSISGFKRHTRNNTIVRDGLFALTQSFLTDGISVIVEQAFRKDEVERYKRVSRRLHIRCVLVQLSAPRAVLLKRIIQRSKRPDTLKRPPVPLSRMKRNLRRFYLKGDIGAIVIETTNKNPRQVATAIRKIAWPRRNK